MRGVDQTSHALPAVHTTSLSTYPHDRHYQPPTSLPTALTTPAPPLSPGQPPPLQDGRPALGPRPPPLPECLRGDLHERQPRQGTGVRLALPLQLRRLTCQGPGGSERAMNWHSKGSPRSICPETGAGRNRATQTKLLSTTVPYYAPHRPPRVGHPYGQRVGGDGELGEGGGGGRGVALKPTPQGRHARDHRLRGRVRARAAHEGDGGGAADRRGLGDGEGRGAEVFGSERGEAEGARGGVGAVVGGEVLDDGAEAEDVAARGDLGAPVGREGGGVRWGQVAGLRVAVTSKSSLGQGGEQLATLRKRGSWSGEAPHLGGVSREMGHCRSWGTRTVTCATSPQSTDLSGSRPCAAKSEASDTCGDGE